MYLTNDHRIKMVKVSHKRGIERDPLVQVFVHAEGGILKDLVHNETVQLDPEMMVAIMKDVTMGLKYLHGHSPPMLEQDLSPMTVILTRDYVAQLAHHDSMMQAVCALPCLALPCLALPCPALPCVTLSCLVLTL